MVSAAARGAGRAKGRHVQPDAGAGARSRGCADGTASAAPGAAPPAGAKAIGAASAMFSSFCKAEDRCTDEARAPSASTVIGRQAERPARAWAGGQAGRWAGGWRGRRPCGTARLPPMHARTQSHTATVDRGAQRTPRHRRGQPVRRTFRTAVRSATSSKVRPEMSSTRLRILGLTSTAGSSGAGSE